MNEDEQGVMVEGLVIAEECVKCIICNLQIRHKVDDMAAVLAVRPVPTEHEARLVELMEEAERAAEAAREFLLSIVE